MCVLRFCGRVVMSVSMCVSVCVQVGVGVLRRYVRDPISMSPVAQRVFELLKYVRASELETNNR
jgi:hypothetical protein